MLNNKTHRILRAIASGKAPKSLHTNLIAIEQAKRLGHCVCTAAGILAVMKGTVRPQCRKMPWCCPFDSQRKTPVA